MSKISRYADMKFEITTVEDFAGSHEDTSSENEVVHNPQILFFHELHKFREPRNKSWRRD